MNSLLKLMSYEIFNIYSFKFKNCIMRSDKIIER